MSPDTCFDCMVYSHGRGDWLNCLILARMLRDWLTVYGNPRLRDWEERLPVMVEIETSSRRNLNLPS